MLWFLLALCSAFCLGLYDVAKKQALGHTSVVPLLFINTLLCSLFFLPLIMFSASGKIESTSSWYVPFLSWKTHLWVLLKALLVLGSWLCGYCAIKHLPLSLVGPINATRPVLVLLGALFIYAEQLNPWQWAGVGLAILSVFLLSRSGRKEGIHFGRNPWILLLTLAAILGACSGLYDKFLLSPTQQSGLALPALFVQTWYTLYQFLFMLPIFFLHHWSRRHIEVFRWHWSMPAISLFLTAADLVYFWALSQPDALIAVVSMTRRSSVLVSFLFAAFLLHEKNLRSKTFDLFWVLLSISCLCLGAVFS